ncbi:MAG TPA: DUF6572 domain-containing protein [Pirellulales bacterium]|nr:DUF6572 domain-containing protein [Pirellulales bacterium]
MLSDDATIDVMTPIQADCLMMAIMDFHPWSDPASDERLKQFRRKLNAYCCYIVSDQFKVDHPAVDRSKIVISIVSIAPPSALMRQTKCVYTPGQPSYEILVQFADDGYNAAPRTSQAKKTPWWKFW